MQEVLGQIKELFSLPCEYWEAMEHTLQLSAVPLTLPSYINCPVKKTLVKERLDRTKLQSKRPSRSLDDLSEGCSGIAMEL